jgi:hypothetical protein
MAKVMAPAGMKERIEAYLAVKMPAAADLRVRAGGADSGRGVAGDVVV